MDSKRALQVAHRYASLARVQIPCDNAVLFGSHARGDADEHSDIDVGLFVDRLAEDRNVLTVLKALYRLALEVDVHIEPHLFIRDEDPTGFGATVERAGIPL
ncbi:MAG: nucleotidyltransferase domain-containing protein [Deferrisomatales bacterium]